MRAHLCRDPKSLPAGRCKLQRAVAVTESQALCLCSTACVHLGEGRYGGLPGPTSTVNLAWTKAKVGTLSTTRTSASNTPGCLKAAAERHVRGQLKTA